MSGVLVFDVCVVGVLEVWLCIFFFFKQKTAYEMRISDWSSDVCSSDLALGMAIVYTLLGIAAGLAGEGLAAALQNPWVLTAFALLMTGLALAMFDVYQLQMPAAIQSRLTQASGDRKSTRLNSSH